MCFWLKNVAQYQVRPCAGRPQLIRDPDPILLLNQLNAAEEVAFQGGKHQSETKAAQNLVNIRQISVSSGCGRGGAGFPGSPSAPAACDSRKGCGFSLARLSMAYPLA